MKLYNFFRSGTSHRLRIALHLKGLATDYVAVDLRVEEHLKEAFKSLNPQGLVPALAVNDAQVLIQSPAIIEWLEETYPTPALLPTDANDRAHVRALAAIVGCDIHPINNLRILKYLRHELGQSQDAVDTWARHWISEGFAALEALADADQPFLSGAAPGLAFSTSALTMRPFGPEPLRPARSAASVGRSGLVAVTLPSASSVVVAAPKRTMKR
mgnify:CR=1 FL=1